MVGTAIELLSSWSTSVSLDAAGLVALADLDTVARRTALTGTSHYLDSLVICPGLHRQQDATRLHNGEYPPMAAMITGYICRVENPATISYLQRVSQTGHLTLVKVEKRQRHCRQNSCTMQNLCDALSSYRPFRAAVVYLIIVAMTCGAIITFVVSASWWGLGVLATLMLSRLCNVVVIRWRNVFRWHGASEPGHLADNLILLSQDRWVRLQGNLDDVKAVTSGQWLREPTFLDRAITAFATVLVYLTAALASNVDAAGKVLVLGLLLISTGLLSVANELTDTLTMHSCTLSVSGPHTPFARRLAMVSTLIEETGREDWALRLGIVLPEDIKDYADKRAALAREKVGSRVMNMLKVSQSLP